MSAILGAKGAIELALFVLQALPALLEAGAQVKDLLQSTSDALTKMQAEGRGPTDEEWEAVNDVITALREEFHAPDEG